MKKYFCLFLVGFVSMASIFATDSSKLGSDISNYIENLKTALLFIGISMVVIGLVVIGIKFAVTHTLDQRNAMSLAAVVLGGILIASASSAVSAFFSGAGAEITNPAAITIEVGDSAAELTDDSNGQL